MKRTPMISSRWLGACLALVMATAAACSRSGEKAGSSAKMTIKLAENPWTGSSINAHVAKVLLEDLGYNVEIVTIDENAQWAALASGDLSASLEIWPSGHQENVAQYIEQKAVVSKLGELGVVGKIGWYVPSYVVKEHPELATWEGYKDAARTALFKTAETGDKGRFLAGDPSWVQYDADIIKNLGLSLQVLSAGSEQAVLAALDAAYSRKEPVLFYFWTPHAIHAKYDLTEVELPPHSEECYEKIKAGGVACDYPPDKMFKVAWSGLKDKAPDAYQLLTSLSYSTEDQIEMIAAVELEKKSPEQAAKDWLGENEATWKAWMPAKAE